jgi:putative acetyltransferase
VTPLQVRPVEASDVGEVVALVRDVLAEFGITFGVGAATDAQLYSLPQSYTDAGGAFFVARRDGVVVGTAGLFTARDGGLELRKMYLRPAARGHRVGRALWDACLGFARAQGARRIVLDTTEQMQEAIRFYERLGFVRDDAQITAPRCSRGYRLELGGGERQTSS